MTTIVTDPKHLAASYTNAFSSNVTNEIVSGPWMVQEFTFTGTDTGPLTGPMGTIRATNRKVSGECVSITRYENGLDVETRLHFDVVQLLTQLGVMPVASKN